MIRKISLILKVYSHTEYFTHYWATVENDQSVVQTWWLDIKSINDTNESCQLS